MMAKYSLNVSKDILPNCSITFVGDSVMRSVYKDMICSVKETRLLSRRELVKKGEENFMSDKLVSGGTSGEK